MVNHNLAGPGHSEYTKGAHPPIRREGVGAVADHAGSGDDL